MKSRKPRIPAYRHHKAKNLAAVTINGKHIYLGSYNSPESKERYNQEIAKWLASKNGSAPVISAPTGKTTSVNNLVESYLEYASKHYLSADGERTSEFDCIKSAVRPLIDTYGLSPAHEFGPKKLKLVRELMITEGSKRRVSDSEKLITGDARKQKIAKGWSRGTINKAITRIKSMFKWAVAEELIPAEIFQGLQAVAGLRHGRDEVKESSGVAPVTEEDVLATLPYLRTPVADMLRVLLLTGMRPGEVTIMRPCDIDRSKEVWIYAPAKHKNLHRGHARKVPLGPKAQAILTPYLKRPELAYIFSPKEAEEERRKQQRLARKSKPTPSQQARKPKPNGKRRPGLRYDTTTLRRAVAYGIAKANTARKKENPKTKPIPSWHPNQIRHKKATEICEQYGLYEAQMALGHKNADVTQVYVERDMKTSTRIAKETG